MTVTPYRGVTVLAAPSPRATVLFAVGRGGDPARHGPLLEALHARGCTVIAPRPGMAPMPPGLDVLATRRGQAVAALEAFAPAAVPVVGVGHSMGATLLLSLAGATLWSRAGERLAPPAVPALARAALLAPALGWVQAPGALEGVRIPVAAWVGDRDQVAPVAAARAVQGLLPALQVHVAEGAGHFSFLNTPPPHVPEPLPDRATFLAALTRQVGDWLLDAP
ncbi:MAG: hypothetical protein H6702_12280 [Myxococcales bacterium]|nr:hypothetical protein [Myxococcales bacterium]